MHISGKRVYGFMLLEYDKEINEWKPINPKERFDYNPWCYSKGVALMMMTILQKNLPQIDFTIGTVGLTKP
jgi:hypothetical protein